MRLQTTLQPYQADSPWTQKEEMKEMNVSKLKYSLYITMSAEIK